MIPRRNVVGLRSRGLSVHPANIADGDVVVPCEQEGNVDKVGTNNQGAEVTNVAEDKTKGVTPSIDADAKTLSPTVPACETSASTKEDLKETPNAGAGGKVFAARPKAPFAATSVDGTSSNPSMLNEGNLRVLASVESKTRGGTMIPKARFSNSVSISETLNGNHRRECQGQDQSGAHGWGSSSVADTAQESSTRSFLSKLKIVIGEWMLAHRTWSWLSRAVRGHVVLQWDAEAFVRPVGAHLTLFRSFGDMNSIHEKYGGFSSRVGFRFDRVNA